MAIKMWDLAGAEEDRRFSPYCWRIKMALAHKSLPFETVPWRFAEKDAIAFSGQGLVPVIVDGDKVVHDSWTIAAYLDEAYPDRPMLFGSEEARTLSFFFKHWVERTIHPLVLKVVILDIYERLREADKPYFRSSREKRFGRTLEEFAADRPATVATLRTALEPARPVLHEQPFLAGRSPGFADYMLFGAFQFARSVSPVKLIEADDPLYAWRERLFDLHGGLARSAVGY